MQDVAVSWSKLVAVTLWVTSGLIMAAGWVVLLLSPQHAEVAAMLGLTSSALTTGAAVAHVRLYALRTQSMVRMSAGMGDGDGHHPPIRRVHS